MTSKTGTLLLTGLVFVGLLAGVTAPVGASTANDLEPAQAGDVSVGLTPADQTIDAGTSTEFDVVVSGATDGIDAYELNLSLANGTVGNIDEFSFERTPGVGSAEISSNGTQLFVEDARLGDPIAGSETITLGTVTVAGNSDGETTLDLNSAAVSISGEQYNIAELNSGTLTIAGEITDPELGLSLGNETIQTNDATNLTVAATDVTNGVSALNFTITPSDPSVVEFESTTVTGAENPTVTQLDNGALRIEADVTRDNGDIELATTDILAAQVGETNFTLSDVQILDQDGAEYTPRSITGTTLTATSGDSSGVDITLRAADNEVTVNGETTVDVVVQDAQDGVSAFATELTIETPESATITGYEYSLDPQFPDSELGPENNSLSLSAAMGSNVYPPANETTIATVTVRGDSASQVQLAAGGDTRIDDVDGTPYDIGSVSGTSFDVVAGPPAVDGGDRPQDTDGDGTYEDVDGDGSLTIFDVQALFDNLDAAEIQDNPEAFNFDGTENPDEVTVFDVQGLLQEYQSQG